jgi:hypothetical protein
MFGLDSFHRSYRRQTVVWSVRSRLPRGELRERLTGGKIQTLFSPRPPRLMGPRYLVLVRPVVPDRLGTCDEALAVHITSHVGQRIHRWRLIQDQHGTTLMLLRKDRHNVLPRFREIDITNIELIPKLGVVIQDPSDLSAIRAVIGCTCTIGESRFEQEEKIACHVSLQNEDNMEWLDPWHFSRDASRRSCLVRV